MIEVIAEAGITHCGSLKTACELADAAKESGVDVVKFQTFKAETTLRPNDPDFKLIKSLELNYSDFKKLAKHCEGIKIEFMSTPDHLDDLKFLVDECNVKRIKIGSADLLNRPLVEAAYRTGKPVILSTGMATIEEINSILPHDGGFVSITLLHCISLYPTPYDQANLRAIARLRQFFSYPIGYSDHTVGAMAVYLAIALGATVIEKHFCPNGYNGTDKEVSMIPLELKMMIDGIKYHEKMLGSGLKKPSDGEVPMINRLRKGSDGLRGLDRDLFSLYGSK